MSDKHENDFFFLVETDVFSPPFERGLIWNNYVRLSLSFINRGNEKTTGVLQCTDRWYVSKRGQLGHGVMTPI